VETIGRPSDRVIPFDYVVTIPLSGRPKNLVENETTVSAEGGFVATAVGYGLLVEETLLVQFVPPGQIEGIIPDGRAPATVTIERVIETGPPVVSFTVPREGPFTRVLAPGNYDVTIAGTLHENVRVESRRVTNVATGTTSDLASMHLGELPLTSLPPSALIDGIRIRPEFVRLAFTDEAQLNDKLPIGLLGELFERLNRSEDVSFRYTIFDSGRGRELQNQPLHNVAGLGIANGDRPFKRLARPMVFLPRSTIRIQVEERFGRGKLFFVFQGYKILGPTMRGGGA
jgi:hypothetical protein